MWTRPRPGLPRAGLLCWASLAAVALGCGARTSLLELAGTGGSSSSAASSGSGGGSASVSSAASGGGGSTGSTGTGGTGGAVPVSNPFEPGQDWVGTYTCTQGLTHLDLKIVAVQGDTITDAIFAFDWKNGPISGAYHLSGNYDPATQEALFTPGAWIQQPSGWVAVGMEGTVDGDSYHGQIAYAGCGAFSLTRQ